jgi:hypothetical protein
MAGVIDDFQDSLNELLRASNLPVSVCVIKLGGMSDENDSTNLMSLSAEAFAKCDRQFVNVLDYDLNYKKKAAIYSNQDTTDIEQHILKQHIDSYVRKKFKHDLMVAIPCQIEKFFEA